MLSTGMLSTKLLDEVCVRNLKKGGGLGLGQARWLGQMWDGAVFVATMHILFFVFRTLFSLHFGLSKMETLI